MRHYKAVLEIGLFSWEFEIHDDTMCEDEIDDIAIAEFWKIMAGRLEIVKDTRLAKLTFPNGENVQWLFDDHPDFDYDNKIEAAKEVFFDEFDFRYKEVSKDVAMSHYRAVLQNYNFSWDFQTQEGLPREELEKIAEQEFFKHVKDYNYSIHDGTCYGQVTMKNTEEISWSLDIQPDITYDKISCVMRDVFFDKIEYSYWTKRRPENPSDVEQIIKDTEKKFRDINEVLSSNINFFSATQVGKESAAARLENARLGKELDEAIVRRDEMSMLSLTPAEKNLVLGYLKEKENNENKQAHVLHILKVAHDYVKMATRYWRKNDL